MSFEIQQILMLGVLNAVVACRCTSFSTSCGSGREQTDPA